MDIDITIRNLFEKLEARKAKVSDLKTQIGKAWKTNGTFRLFGSGATTNIQTATADTIEEIALQLCTIEAGQGAARQRLKRAIDPKIQGYTIDVWFEDLNKRLATIDVRDQEKQVAELELRLNSVLSPEERRRIEVELIAKEI